MTKVKLTVDPDQSLVEGFAEEQRKKQKKKKVSMIFHGMWL